MTRVNLKNLLQNL